MRKGDESKISFPNPRGLRASPQTYSERGGETYYLFVSNIIQYETSFFIKVHVKVFYIQVRFKCEIPPLLSTEKTLYRKNYIFFCRLCKN